MAPGAHSSAGSRDRPCNDKSKRWMRFKPVSLPTINDRWRVLTACYVRSASGRGCRLHVGLLTSLVLILATISCTRRTEGTRRVRVATYTQGSLTALPLVLAEQLGYFKQEGLAVDVEEMASGAKASQALVGGSADVASAFYELTLQMAAQGRNLISFVNLARYPGYVLMGSPASASKVHRVEDLKNSMVAISSPGSPTDQFLKYVLIQHGLPADAASTVAAGSNAARVAILEHGGVAAAVLSDPAASQFLKRRVY